MTDIEERKEEKKIEDKNERRIAPVKRSRSLAEVPLQGFNALEINFFYTLLYFCQNKKSEKVKISFDDFREMTGYKRRGDKALINKLQVMSQKFAQITLMEKKKNGGFKIVVPFIDFEVDPDEKSFIVGIHQEFMSAINDLDGSEGKRYALADVISIVQMKSTYSKNCLGHLSVYRNKDLLEMTTEEMKYYFDIPQKYRTSDINDKVLSVIKKEFAAADIFDHFDITPRMEASRKKSTGRKKILGYLFSYRFTDDYLGGLGRKKKKEVKKESIDCPKCGKPLIPIERKDGSGIFFGHRDGWSESAPCRFTISADKLGKGQVPKVSDNESQESTSVTKSELENYYRHIREENVIALGHRKDEIREKEPEIWAIYMDLEKMRADSLNAMAAFAFSEEGKLKKREIQNTISEARDKLKASLVEKGYDEKFLEVRFKCPICRDTGQKDDGLFCSCRALRIQEAAEWQKEK